MVLKSERSGALVRRLLSALLLLGWTQVSSAAGTWSAIPLPQDPDQVLSPRALAVDAAGNLYGAGSFGDAATWIVGTRISKRDTQGSWSRIDTSGTNLDEFDSADGIAFAVDAAGNLYIVDAADVLERNAQGHWSVIATDGRQVDGPNALAVDSAGSLYVADEANSIPGRIQKRDAQGNWSVIATQGAGALAVDAAGTLYMADSTGRIQRRDAQGNWSVIATHGTAPGQVDFGYGSGLAADGAGNLYVAESCFDFATYTSTFSRIQKWDAQGNWSVIATSGSDLGEVEGPFGLTVDTAGNLYVADNGNNRLLKHMPVP